MPLVILALVCAALCSVGFKKIVYFISTGYGFAVAGGGIAILIISLVCDWTDGVFGLLFVQMLLFVFYGLRLSGYIIYREKMSNYRQSTAVSERKKKRETTAEKVIVWIVVSILYTAMLSPVLFRYQNECDDKFVPILGIIISLIGLLVEGIADAQKSKQKKRRPDMVATKGLYKIVRCPNYFGEILFWVGVYIGGISAYDGTFQWIFATIGLVCIVFIMFHSAHRLDRRQEKVYGHLTEYRDYADNTPLIVPYLPLYHL